MAADLVKEDQTLFDNFTKRAEEFYFKPKRQIVLTGVKPSIDINGTLFYRSASAQIDALC